MQKARRKELGLQTDDKITEELAKEEEDLPLPLPLAKSKTVGVPFEKLSGGAAIEAPDVDMEPEKSKVFQKRDRLFTMLGAINLDVQHAENLWMVADRLRSIDTNDRVKEWLNH